MLRIRHRAMVRVACCRTGLYLEVHILQCRMRNCTVMYMCNVHFASWNMNMRVRLFAFPIFERIFELPLIRFTPRCLVSQNSQLDYCIVQMSAVNRAHLFSTDFYEYAPRNRAREGAPFVTHSYVPYGCNIMHHVTSVSCEGKPKYQHT